MNNPFSSEEFIDTGSISAEPTISHLGYILQGPAPSG